MSSKQMYKVQEEVTSLKQLLSLVTNGLQRNACAIEKLKVESAQVGKRLFLAWKCCWVFCFATLGVFNIKGFAYFRVICELGTGFCRFYSLSLPRN